MKKSKKNSVLEKIISMRFFVGFAIILLILILVGNNLIHKNNRVDDVERSMPILQQNSQKNLGSDNYVNEHPCDVSKSYGSPCIYEKGFFGNTFGYCDNGECKKKTCENVYGDDAVRCSNSETDCCPPGNVCCNKANKNSHICCDNEYQECSVLSVFGLKYNLCADKKCPDKNWHICGDYKDARAVCCKHEDKCSEEDFFNNRCGDGCGKKLHKYNSCSIKKSCPNGYKKYKGSYNTVCCKKGFETKVNSHGILLCRRDKCNAGQTLCKGEGWDYKNTFNVCCDDGELCFHDTDGYPRCKSKDHVSGYPWVHKKTSDFTSSGDYISNE